MDTELFDGENNPIDPDGISPVSLYPFIPLRRHITEPWIKVFGKIDDGGYEQFAPGEGITKYTARGDGELFFM